MRLNQLDKTYSQLGTSPLGSPRTVDTLI